MNNTMNNTMDTIKMLCYAGLIAVLSILGGETFDLAAQVPVQLQECTVCGKYQDKCEFRGNHPDFNEAKLKAQKGDPKAQFELGVCYFYGKGVSENEEEAVKWWRKAANQGLAEAQFNLARCYENGEGIQRNYAEAMKWYRKAAEQGHEDAKESLQLID